MRLLYIACLGLAVVSAGAIDYRQVTTYTGPCVRELAVMAKEGDIRSAREQARALCRADATTSCPDLWLLYAYCEMELNEPGALAVCEDVVHRLPKSAAAHLIYAMAIIQEQNTGGLVRALAAMRNMRRELEKAIVCDPDCHPARAGLTLIYSMPALIGGDASKFRYHLSELERRDPYSAAMAHGMIEAQRRNYSAAGAYYREAYRLDTMPVDHDSMTGLIKTISRQGNYSEAFALCEEFKPLFPGDRTNDAVFVELSARSGLHTDEALVASERYIATAKGVTPQERAEVLINTAIILRKSGYTDEADRLLSLAENERAGSRKEFLSREKEYQSKRPIVAAR